MKRKSSVPAAAPRGGTREVQAATAPPVAAPPVGISAVQGLAASAKVIELAHGLYALSIGETRETRREVAGMIVPATHIGGVALGGRAGPDIIGAGNGPAGWLGPDGGTLVVKIPSAGSHVLLTTYRPADQPAIPLEIQITRLDRPRPKATAPGPAPAAAPPARREPERPATPDPATRNVKTEIVLHIERLGDRVFAGGDWIGSRGSKQRIEAFTIRPLEAIAPHDIEYKAFGPNGRETPWITDAQLCGTRGRGMPLTGFAIRLAPHLRERFDVLYEGAFFDSGISRPSRNGEPCLPSRVDDPLEAVNVRLIERAGK